MISINTNRLPPGLTHDVETTTAYSTLRSEDAIDIPQQVPSLVACYSDGPLRPTSRWAMITRIDSSDAEATFNGMTAAEHWIPWQSEYETTHAWLTDPDPMRPKQVVFHSRGIVIWVSTMSLDEDELRAVVASIEITE